MAVDQTLTARSPYNNVSTETVAGEIQAAAHNTNYANLELAIEAHRHGLNTSVGWDSMKANFRPPDTADSTNRWRIVCGVKAYSVGSGSGNVIITFATDADQGDPSFTTAPRVTATAATDNSSIGWILTIDKSATSTTGASFYIKEDNGGASDDNIEIHWIAYGKVA